MKLPERKKSAEEIAKLRDELGVFARPPAPQAAAPTPEIAVEKPAAPVLPPQSGFSTTPVRNSRPLPAPSAPDLSPLPVHPPAKPVSSLRKSERIPELPISHPSASPVFEPAPESPATPEDRPAVHSLRKSEQIAAPLAKPAALPTAESHLPAHRHSDQSLNEIRRQTALAARLTPPPPVLKAEWPWVIIGYLSVLAGPILLGSLQTPIGAAVSEGLAILVAAFIFFKRPYSRHHAGFLLLIALLVTIFGALYHFPQLRHVP
ncbi:MAG: hypothetical protein QM680_00040 [Luteolibacter sp.]